MYDKVVDFGKFKNLKPIHAEGKICIDITDPVTGKVKERVDGKNYVFKENLLTGASKDWIGSTSGAMLVLNDSTADIDTTVPFILGQTVGYGRPSLGTSGTRRGAYNAANQALEVCTAASVRWKFQYDFTTAQANATIGTIGLTSQYSDVNRIPIYGFKDMGSGLTGNSLTNDGRYAYACSTAGIITKYDLWLGTSSTINVSAVVGTTSGTTKTVGYSGATGKYYIYTYSATTTLRFMYEFSNNSFSSLLNTYSASNIALSNASSCPMYIYGNYAFWGGGDNTSYIVYIANFVSNTALVTQNSYVANNAITNEGLSYGTGCNTMKGSMCSSKSAGGKYIYFGIGSNNFVGQQGGAIYDMSAQAQVGTLYSAKKGSNTSLAAEYPLQDIFMPCSTSAWGCNHAMAGYKLPTPVIKTSANGMTATYELEVFWE